MPIGGARWDTRAQVIRWVLSHSRRGPLIAFAARLMRQPAARRSLALGQAMDGDVKHQGGVGAKVLLQSLEKSGHGVIENCKGPVFQYRV